MECDFVTYWVWMDGSMVELVGGLPVVGLIINGYIKSGGDWIFLDHYRPWILRLGSFALLFPLSWRVLPECWSWHFGRRWQVEAA